MSIDKIVERYKLRLLVQFGSSIRGKTHPGSDVDFAYLSKSPLSLEEEGMLILDLAKAMKIAIEKIDLSSLHRAKNPTFLFELFKSAKPLYMENATIFDKYKLYSINIYFDTQKYRDISSAFLKNRVEKHRRDLNL
jgi:predicted nucleotidyltransferase